MKHYYVTHMYTQPKFFGLIHNFGYGYSSITTDGEEFPIAEMYRELRKRTGCDGVLILSWQELSDNQVREFDNETKSKSD